MASISKRFEEFVSAVKHLMKSVVNVSQVSLRFQQLQVCFVQKRSSFSKLLHIQLSRHDDKSTAPLAWRRNSPDNLKIRHVLVNTSKWNNYKTENKKYYIRLCWQEINTKHKLVNIAGIIPVTMFKCIFLEVSMLDIKQSISLMTEN